MLRSLAISSFLFVGAFPPAQAGDVYRWVDDHGGLHYTDQWVPGSEVIKSTKPRPSSASSAAPQQEAPKAAASPNLADAGKQSATLQAMQQDKAKVREQQCKEAKERYEKSIEARRIYKIKPGNKPGETSKDIDGQEQREYLSDAEADSFRLKARQAMEDSCGSSAGKSSE